MSVLVDTSALYAALVRTEEGHGACADAFRALVEQGPAVVPELIDRLNGDDPGWRLEALLAVADAETSLVITGNGDVIEPEDSLIAIGSGGPYAQAAARALMDNTPLGAPDIVGKALTIAGDICVFTNHHHTIETLG